MRLSLFLPLICFSFLLPPVIYTIFKGTNTKPQNKTAVMWGPRCQGILGLPIIAIRKMRACRGKIAPIVKVLGPSRRNSEVLSQFHTLRAAGV